MTSSIGPGPRILGSLRSADGKGIVHIEDRFEAELRSVVMSEIAKTDLGGELSIEPLTASKGFPDLRHILGLIIRNGGNLATQARGAHHRRVGRSADLQNRHPRGRHVH